MQNRVMTHGIIAGDKHMHASSSLWSLTVAVVSMRQQLVVDRRDGWTHRKLYRNCDGSSIFMTKSLLWVSKEI